MAELSYPNPSVTQVQHERLMGGGSASGVFGHPADAPVVFAPGSGTREVRLRANRRALVEGYGWESDDTEVVLPSLAANSSGSTRVDLVVLRLDRAAWTVRAAVVPGTPGAGAPSPSYSTGTSGTWELPLAEVTVDSGATTIAGSKVKSRAWYVGSDGQIRCTPDTRPPHEAGRVIWEHPTGAEFVSSGTSWMPVASDASGTITAPTGFSHSGVVLHRRNGMVTVALTFWRPAAALNANTEYKVGTVQDGFRPVKQTPSVGICPSNQSVLTYSVDTNGVVLINPGAQSIPANRSCVLASMTYPHA
ncbi:hypothetical protein M2302_000259 [Micromonospora sp. A200]|uniref:hypothetical protein n=1 Tax=Micromonospora sp. A200 TaxID=2940568 RepID=UPI002475F5AE|nr:hypothetical protein [Micromonospora sp. A200]MDH6460108.1 hypothetical protein [Micromonospora sp. A200]